MVVPLSRFADSANMQNASIESLLLGFFPIPFGFAARKRASKRPATTRLRALVYSALPVLLAWRQRILVLGVHPHQVVLLVVVPTPLTNTLKASLRARPASARASGRSFWRSRRP